MNYQEYKQLLNRELAKKVQREFDEFRKDILTKNPQEIYDSACQIVLKSDIAVFIGRIYAGLLLILKRTWLRQKGFCLERRDSSYGYMR